MIGTYQRIEFKVGTARIVHETIGLGERVIRVVAKDKNGKPVVVRSFYVDAIMDAREVNEDGAIQLARNAASKLCAAFNAKL